VDLDFDPSEAGGVLVQSVEQPLRHVIDLMAQRRCEFGQRGDDRAGPGLVADLHARLAGEGAQSVRRLCYRDPHSIATFSESAQAVRTHGWTFLTQLKINRKVDLGRQGYRAVAEVAIDAAGTIVHLEGFGSIRVFKVVSRDGDIEYWATNDLAMDELTRLSHAEQSWGIETYHRGLKQCCGVERAQVRAARAQRNHIGLAIRAFLRLEHHFYTTGVSWYEAKARIIRGAVRAYIANPMYKLP
jgi:hypothetical protein